MIGKEPLFFCNIFLKSDSTQERESSFLLYKILGMCSNLPTSFWLRLYFLGKLCFTTRRHSSGFWSFSAGGSDSHLCPEGHSSRSVPLPHRAEGSGREKGCERFTAGSREQRRGPGVTFPVSPSWGHCWMASRAVCPPQPRVPGPPAAAAPSRLLLLAGSWRSSPSAGISCPMQLPSCSKPSFPHLS